MNEKTGLESIIPGKKAIGLMVLRGFGLFLTISGMVGMTLILGPLNHIIQDLTFTLVFDSKLYAFLLCLLLAVIGGAIDFLTNEGLKAIEK
jgi:hypothetical protein